VDAICIVIVFFNSILKRRNDIPIYGNINNFKGDEKMNKVIKNVTATMLGAALLSTTIAQSPIAEAKTTIRY